MITRHHVKFWESPKIKNQMAVEPLVILKGGVMVQDAQCGPVDSRKASAMIACDFK